MKGLVRVEGELCEVEGSEGGVVVLKGGGVLGEVLETG